MRTRARHIGVLGGSERCHAGTVTGEALDPGAGGASGRFAPSPSGPLHLGNLRTALLAWLFARSAGAGFELRVEDLDPDRSRPEHERGQIADLAAIGLSWDGPPWRQSERGDAYRDALARLRERELVYPCWCTRAELRAAASAPHGALPAAYPGTCRGLSAGERRARERSGRPPAWRLDAGGRVGVALDRLHGPLEAAVDDFVVWRGCADGEGVAAYNLAVVVDDAAQGIEEVVRGDDLLTSAPRQALLAELLGLAVPRYAHVPLVLGPDGTRLAKRHAAVTLAEQLHAGASVELVVGWLAASCGLVPGPAELTAGEVLEAFDPARIVREPTVLDGALVAV